MGTQGGTMKGSGAGYLSKLYDRDRQFFGVLAELQTVKSMDVLVVGSRGPVSSALWSVSGSSMQH